MGCGASKSSKEPILEVATVPAVREKPRPPALVALPSNKLAPEVLDGFAKLLRRFTTVEVTAKGKATARSNAGVKSARQGPAGSTTMPVTKTKEERKELPKQVPIPEKQPESPVAKPVEEPPAPVMSQPLVEKEVGMVEPKHAFGDMSDSHMEEQRYSPEPPRPQSLSDEESAQPYEDESLRKRREELERQAQEEAERKAARDRAEAERLAFEQKGKMTTMQNQANDILSKYQ